MKLLAFSQQSRSSKNIVTRGYVLSCFLGYMRIFRGSDGTYVGGIKPAATNDKNIDPSCVTTDDANHRYFIDSFRKKLCHMDL